MNNVDYIEEIDGRDSMSLAERELKGAPSVFMFSSSVSAINSDGVTTKIDWDETDKSATFTQNFKYWNKETGLLSTNNLDNAYFRQIVDMGVDAVPYIVKELKKGPTPLVHALDMIFPNVVEYNGFVSLKDACDKWISILQ
jgi:hypothetical protein